MGDAGPTKDATRILLNVTKGSRAAVDELFPLIYDELRALAARALERERPGHTLQATALVHEAYVRLIAYEDVDSKDRAHFLGLAAQAVRRILVDHARRRGADKRGADALRITLDDECALFERRDMEILAVDEALESLAALDPRQSRVVELRFFAGLSVEETAQVLDVSPRTVKDDWSMARAWLCAKLSTKDE